MGFVKYHKNKVMHSGARKLKAILSQILSDHYDILRHEVFIEITGWEDLDASSIKHIIRSLMMTTKKVIEYRDKDYWEQNEPMWMSDEDIERVEVIKKIQEVRSWISNNYYKTEPAK